MVGQLSANKPLDSRSGWKSSNTDLLTIKQDGSFILWSRPGRVTVTATGISGEKATTEVTVLDRYLNFHQSWRAISDTCTLKFDYVPNTDIVVRAQIVRDGGECPASIPVMVKRRNGTIYAEGRITPTTPFTFLFKPVKSDTVEVYAETYGQMSLENPAATLTWDGVEF